MKGELRYELRKNEDLEGWDLLAIGANEEHDGDGDKDWWIATFYDEFYAKLVKDKLTYYRK